MNVFLGELGIPIHLSGSISYLLESELNSVELQIILHFTVTIIDDFLSFMDCHPFAFAACFAKLCLAECNVCGTAMQRISYTVCLAPPPLCVHLFITRWGIFLLLK